MFYIYISCICGVCICVCMQEIYKNQIYRNILTDRNSVIYLYVLFKYNREKYK